MPALLMRMVASPHLRRNFDAASVIELGSVTSQ
jgi:hypothetical protein